MRKEYDNLKELILKNINTPEPKDALVLIDKLKDVKTFGFFSKKQFLEVAMWKSPRPKNHYLNNSEEVILETSRRALSLDDERIRMGILTTLNGVSIAVASALLTIINPKQYGVIDIRVWQLLFLYGEVKTKPQGQGFNVDDWTDYLSVLRRYALEFEVNVRDIERVCFFYHKKMQEGLLYEPVKNNTPRVSSRKHL